MTAGDQVARAQGPSPQQQASVLLTYVGTANAGLEQINEATAEALHQETGLVSR